MASSNDFSRITATVVDLPDNVKKVSAVKVRWLLSVQWVIDGLKIYDIIYLQESVEWRRYLYHCPTTL